MLRGGEEFGRREIMAAAARVDEVEHDGRPAVRWIVDGVKSKLESRISTVRGACWRRAGRCGEEKGDDDGAHGATPASPLPARS